ncbi:MAG: hypothetical protein GY915_06255 [bacterium]|nr:hypothetical protein [bacterium]
MHDYLQWDPSGNADKGRQTGGKGAAFNGAAHPWNSRSKESRVFRDSLYCMGPHQKNISSYQVYEKEGDQKNHRFAPGTSALRLVHRLQVLCAP